DPTGAESIHSRSVQLSSERLRIIAKIDLVEGDQGAVRPVDYKKGSPRDSEDGPQVWPADRVQVAAQALILRDNGYACSDAVVYYYGTKQRVHVAIDDATLAETEAAIERARHTAVARRIPPPL